MEEFSVYPSFERQWRSKKKYYWLLIGLISLGIALQIFTLGSEYVVFVKEGNKMDKTRGEVHDFMVYGHDFLYNASVNLDDLMDFVRTQTAEASHKVDRATSKINSLDHDVRADLRGYDEKFDSINEKVELMASQVNHSVTVVDEINTRFTKLMDKLDKLGL